MTIETWIILLILLLLASSISWFVTGKLITILLKFRIVDHPKIRGLHDQIIPRGGGLAIIFTVTILAMLIDCFGLPMLPTVWIVLGFALLLGLLNFADDCQDLSMLWRFLAQITAVFSCLYLGTLDRISSDGWLPIWAEWGLMALTWLWFMNALNFLDGSDGYAVSHAILITLFIAAVSWFRDPVSTPNYLIILILGSSLGFLYWNRPKAKIFLGDSGAVWLGFIIAWLLLDLGARGFRESMFILPAWIIGDASITLIWRICIGSQPWQAHGNHFVQRAIRAGNSHTKILLFSCSMALIIGSFAILASRVPVIGLVSTIVIALVGLGYMDYIARRGGMSLIAAEKRLADNPELEE